MRRRTTQVPVLVLAVWQVAAAALSQSGLLPGDDVGAISDRYDSAVDPAGWAFAIWGLIYTTSLVLAVFQARDVKRRDELLADLRTPLMVAFALNGIWIIAFSAERFIIAQAVLVALTAALAMAYARLGAGGRPRDRAERWVVHTGVGLYLGWATVAGASTTLLALGVDRALLSPETWAVVLVLVAGAVAVGVTLGGPPEPGFPLAAAWALAAIAVEQQSRGRGGVAAVAGVAALAAVAALVMRDHRINRRLGDAVRAA